MTNMVMAAEGPRNQAEKLRQKQKLNMPMQKPKTNQKICRISPVIGANEMAITPTNALIERQETKRIVQEGSRAAQAVAPSQAAAPRAAAPSPTCPKVRPFRVVACAASTNRGGQLTAVDPKCAKTNLARSNTLKASKNMTN